MTPTCQNCYSPICYRCGAVSNGGGEFYTDDGTCVQAFTCDSCDALPMEQQYEEAYLIAKFKGDIRSGRIGLEKREGDRLFNDNGRWATSSRRRAVPPPAEPAQPRAEEETADTLRAQVAELAAELQRVKEREVLAREPAEPSHNETPEEDTDRQIARRVREITSRAAIEAAAIEAALKIRKEMSERLAALVDDEDERLALLKEFEARLARADEADENGGGAR